MTRGEALASARLDAGLTQRELSARCGIWVETISQIERDRIDPKSSTLDRIRAAIPAASPDRATGSRSATVGRTDRRTSGV